MKSNMNKVLMFFISVLLVLSLFGCGNNGSMTTKYDENDTFQTEDNNDKGAVSDMVDKTGDAAKDVADGLGDAADDVSDGVKNGLDNMKE